MSKKNMPKYYDYYTMKIPTDLKEFFEKYIKKYKSLGFKKVSQFVLHLLQQEAKKILKENPDLDQMIEVKRI